MEKAEKQRGSAKKKANKTTGAKSPSAKKRKLSLDSEEEFSLDSEEEFELVF